MNENWCARRFVINGDYDKALERLKATANQYLSHNDAYVRDMALVISSLKEKHLKKALGIR